MTEHVPLHEIETKASGDDVAHAFDEFMRAFEAFKEANDERLDQIESRMSADALTLEKLERVNRALDEHRRMADELALKSVRPPLAGDRAQVGATRQHKAAFDNYVRHGETHDLRRLEEKALSVGEGADGGFLVPEETETTVMRSLADVSPIRAIAGIRRVSATTYKKPFAITGAGAGWVGETAARPETIRRRWRSSPSPPWSSTPCRRRRRRCSTTRPSMSTPGWPRRCASPSPSRRAPPS